MKSFKERYCEKFNCPPRLFAERVMRECVHPDGRKLAGLLRPLLPALLTEDIHFIEQLGELRDMPTIAAEVRDFRNEYRWQGLLRGKFKVRVSGQLLVNLANSCFEESPTRSEACGPNQKTEPISWPGL